MKLSNMENRKTDIEIISINEASETETYVVKIYNKKLMQQFIDHKKKMSPEGTWTMPRSLFNKMKYYYKVQYPGGQN